MLTAEDKTGKRKIGNEPPVPPGFKPLTSFTLKRLRSNDEESRSITFGGESEAETAHIGIDPDILLDSAKLEKFLSHRPWLFHNQLYSAGESDPEHLDTNLSDKDFLPNGVSRGYSSCNDSPKVTTSCCPGETCIPDINDAPVFHPTEEEFKSPLLYIASIREQAEKYGICSIVPPPSWQPRSRLKEKNVWGLSRFRSCIQRINELEMLYSRRKLKGVMEKLDEKRRTSFTGSYASGDGCMQEHDEVVVSTTSFSFEDGPEFSMEKFRRYADDFKGQYFRDKDQASGSVDYSSEVQEQFGTSLKDIETEYWRIVGNPTKKIEVVFGTDLEDGVLGADFWPSSPDHLKSGWILKNLSKLPGSLLSFGSRDDTTLAPKLHVGMCFSSNCWKVEEHHLYSVSYTHLGAAKMWYGIPGKYLLKFEALMKKTFPDVLRHPELLCKLVTHLSPCTLKSEGIPVYRCVQHPNQFILVFPGVYYSGFDCGFNCSESVSLAPLDWLPHGQNAVELYSVLGRKTLISHDKILLGCAMEAVRALWEISLLRKDFGENRRWKNASGKDGFLTKILKFRVVQERTKREYLCDLSQSRKMDEDFDSGIKRECSICFYDLHLSAAGCACSPDKYSCLEHSKQLCSCPWSSRFFIFRYEISELDELVDALEGKLSAVQKWAKERLALSMFSQLSK